MKTSLLRALRDNTIANALGRRVLRRALALSPALRPLAQRYRVYGDVRVGFGEATFAIHTEGDDHFANALYYRLPHEEPELSLVQAHARRGRAAQFVDVGANTGVFSLVAAATNPKLSVTAVEPAPGNVRRLERNLQLNRGLDIRLVRCALGDRGGSVEFAVPNDGSISTVSSANVAFSSNFNQTQFTTTQVEVRKLDDVLSSRPLGAGDLIKIDVETYERPVLLGARETLSQGPDVLIEVWHAETLARAFPHLAKTVEPDHAQAVEAIFLEHGYRTYSIESGGIAPLRSILSEPEKINYFFSRRRFDRLTPFDAIFGA